MTTKKLITFLITITFIILGYGIAIPLGEYLRETKGVNLYYISLLFSLYSLGQLISAPILGWIGDEFGSKKVMILGIIIYIISFELTINVHNPTLILILRFVTGVSAGATILNIESYIGEYSPEDNRVLYFTLTSLAIALGMILGPIIGIVIIKHSFVISVTWIIISLLIIILLNKYMYQGNLQRVNNKFIKDFFYAFLEAIKDPKNMYVFLGFLILGLVSSSLEATGVAFIIDNYKIEDINVLFVLILIIIVMCYVLFLNTTITMKVNKYKYSMVMVFLTAVGLIVMGISQNINILLLGFLILILGLSSVVSTMSTLITLNSKKNGMLLGIRNAIMGLGAISGPIISASLYTLNSHLFLFILSIISLSVILYAYIKKVYD